MLDQTRKEIALLVSEAAGVSESEALASLELPKNEFGDLACTIAFTLAKAQRKNPLALASEIAGKVKKHGFIEKAEANGPYINFYFNEGHYAAEAGELLKLGEKYGAGSARGKVLVEFPSVNPNKPWHIGHLRNALLGDSVASILSFTGYNVEREDYIDDLGLQVAQSIWGYFHISSDARGQKFDHWLGEEYVEVAKKMEDKKTEAEVREILKELEHGESGNAEKAREIVERCVKAQYETAFNFGIYHDVLIFESDIVRTIFKEGLEAIKKSGAVVLEKEGKNAGCLVAKMEGKEFEGMESADKILIRSDGTATYTGKDVAFHLWKFGKLKNKFKYSEFMLQPNGKKCYKTSVKGTEMAYGSSDKIVNVIGMEQAYPQKVVAEILRKMGYKKEADGYVHLAYEHVWLEDEKFSGRQGTWIGFTADELLDEGTKRAAEKIKKEMTEEEKAKVSKAVALAAIRFSFLRTTPEKKIIFKWDDALSFEGDSGPYVQYAHARATRILEKAKEAGVSIPKKPGKFSLNKEEKSLLNLLARFPETVARSSRDCRTHYVCDYLLEVASMFNKFYNTSPVLAEGVSPELRAQRLLIVEATRTVLSNGLLLLGIEPLEKM